MALSSDNCILIVEDDPKTASLVAMYLEREGFETVIAPDGQQALFLHKRQKFIFVVLDLMIPHVDGWEVCRQIRRSSDVPILMLTAREDEIDRITGLTLGADDYVIKPFSPRELVARVKAILRRLYPDGDAIVIDRVVDVHIGKLRQKIEKDPSRPRFILTVRGIGYQFAQGRQS